jgi:hypothetical protein
VAEFELVSGKQVRDVARSKMHPFIEAKCAKSSESSRAAGHFTICRPGVDKLCLGMRMTRGRNDAAGHSQSIPAFQRLVIACIPVRGRGGGKRESTCETRMKRLIHDVPTPRSGSPTYLTLSSISSPPLPHLSPNEHATHANHSTFTLTPFAQP